jgi:hypothetical protein
LRRWRFKLFLAAQWDAAAQRSARYHSILFLAGNVNLTAVEIGPNGYNHRLIRIQPQPETE